MKFNTTLIAAAALIAAGSANAAINAGNNSADQGGELILSVWNDAAEASYTLDLGIDVMSFDGNGTIVVDLSQDANWNAYKAEADLAGSTWDVVGAHTSYTYGIEPDYNTVMLTGSATAAGIVKNDTNTLRTKIGNYAGVINAGATDYAVDESTLILGGSYAGNTATWGSFQGYATYAKGAYGDSMAFWMAQDGYTASYSEYFAVTELAGTWTLSGDQLVYNAVPVPAAVWLLASSLIGLVGVARRRK